MNARIRVTQNTSQTNLSCAKMCMYGSHFYKSVVSEYFVCSANGQSRKRQIKEAASFRARWLAEYNIAGWWDANASGGNRLEFPNALHSEKASKRRSLYRVFRILEWRCLGRQQPAPEHFRNSRESMDKASNMWMQTSHKLWGISLKLYCL